MRKTYDNGKLSSRQRSGGGVSSQTQSRSERNPRLGNKRKGPSLLGENDFLYGSVVFNSAWNTAGASCCKQVRHTVESGARVKARATAAVTAEYLCTREGLASHDLLKVQIFVRQNTRRFFANLYLATQLTPLPFTASLTTCHRSCSCTATLRVS